MAMFTRTMRLHGQPSTVKRPRHGLTALRSSRRPVAVDGEPRPRPHAGAVRSAQTRAARTAAALFCIVAAFHAALALGAPWGAYTQGGGTGGTLTASGRVTAAVSCALSLTMAAAILSRVGRGPLRRLRTRPKAVLVWSTATYAAIGVVLNLITRSTAERAVWAPVSIALLGLVSFVVLTTARTPVPGRGDRGLAGSRRAQR